MKDNFTNHRKYSKPQNKPQKSKLHNSREHKYCTLMNPRIRPLDFVLFFACQGATIQ